MSVLRSLSDRDILSRIQELTRRERSATLGVLLHLNEIERRMLHLRQGYPSMFAYCTDCLGYSESAANLRIRAARCIARFPEVHGLLEANEVNVSTVAQVSKVLTEENKADVLFRMKRKSQREVEAIVAEYDPRAVLPGDRVRTVVMRVPVGVSEALAVSAAADPASTTVAVSANGEGLGENHLRNGGEREDSAALRPAEHQRCSGGVSGTQGFEPACPAGIDGAVLIEARKVFQFTATEAFLKKFAKIRALAAHRLGPSPSYEQVFELAMDCFIEKEDPEARAERRQKRRERTAVEPREIGTGPAKMKAPAPGGKSDGRSRYVAAAVRDKVFTRDEGRCTFVAPDGRRCASRHALQVDHIEPVARGGASTSDNLRLLCAHHNRLEAERLMGPWSGTPVRDGSAFRWDESGP